MLSAIRLLETAEIRLYDNDMPGFLAAGDALVPVARQNAMIADMLFYTAFKLSTDPQLLPKILPQAVTAYRHGGLESARRKTAEQLILKAAAHPHADRGEALDALDILVRSQRNSADGTWRLLMRRAGEAANSHPDKAAYSARLCLHTARSSPDSQRHAENLLNAKRLPHTVPGAPGKLQPRPHTDFSGDLRAPIDRIISAIQMEFAPA
jgi:hypothetical protein